MLKIFLCEPIHPRALALLKTRAEVFSDPACLGRADAAISRNLRMDAAFLEQCPALKVIGIHGTGTDRVDLLRQRSAVCAWYMPRAKTRSLWRSLS